MLHRCLARDYDHLAGRRGAGRVNVHELLRLPQTEHDETAQRADSLHEQIERLTTSLTETEARLTELTATRKVINGLTPPDHATAPAETTVYQRIVTTINEHPVKVLRVHDLHEHLDLPTDEPSINGTRRHPGRLVRQRLPEQPGQGRYQKRT